MSTGVDNFARMMQPANDLSFGIETKFDSGLNAAEQRQGVLIEQDADDLLQVEFFYDATGQTQLVARAYVAGVETVVGDPAMVVGGADMAPLYLRVTRDASTDQWTVEYSTDGTVWTPYTTFTHALAVTSVGPFAGNSGATPPAHTAVVDYFFNSADVIDPEDPLVLNAPVLDPIGDQSAVFDVPLSVPLTASDADGDPLTLTSSPALSFVTLTDNGDGTGSLDLNPVAGDAGVYNLTVKATDACGLYDWETIRLTITSGIVSTIVSDDFNACVLDPLWTFLEPGDATLTLSGTQAVIQVPAGQAHDVWGTGPGDFSNTTARVMQACNDADFQLEVKFESGLTQNYQANGILVQQDADDLLIFNFHKDNSAGTEIVALQINNGVGSNLGDWGVTVAPAGTQPQYMRISRVGHVWTVDWSLDGSSWTTYKSFTHVMTVSSVGFYLGTSDVPAHTTVVDYFFNGDSPIVPEDPIAHSAPVVAPIADVVMNEGDSQSVPVQATDADEDPLTLSLAPPLSFATLTDNGDGTGAIELNPVAGDEGLYTLTVTATDACGLFGFETLMLTIGPISPATVTLWTVNRRFASTLTSATSAKWP